MKANESTPAGHVADEEQKVMTAIHRNERRLRWLTGIALGFWSAAVALSLAVFVFYRVFYEPKEKQMFHELESLQQTSSGTPPATTRRFTIENALSVHYTMTYVMTKGILLMAGVVITLSAGTLATLLLVLANRRITLRQLNAGLSGISRQLVELRQSIGSK